MVLHSQFAVSALNFLLGALALYTQYFVVVAFDVTRQNDLPPACKGKLPLVLGILRDLYHRGPEQPVFQFVPAL
jgi:hypothetical protein